MQGASEDTKKAIEATYRLGDQMLRTAGETQRLADEAKRSTELAKDTRERQLRAYVGVLDDVLLVCPLCDKADGTQPIEIPFERIFENFVQMPIQNGGQTPAYDLTVDNTFYYLPFKQRLPKDSKYPIFPATNADAYAANGVGSLNPGERATPEMLLDGSVIPLIIKARKKQISLFYYGNLYYTDVFGVRRTTPFCYEYFPDHVGGPFGNCPEHNTPEQGK